VQISVAFDFRCGYSYKAARFLRELSKAGEPVDVVWRPFSLEQVNEEHGAGVRLWEHPEIETGSFLGLGAGRWIALRDPAAFDRYLWSAFEAMHDDGRTLTRKLILKLAKAAGAEPSALDAALDSGEAALLAGDEFVELQKLGVFGTPTFFFATGEAVYVRLRGVWEDETHRKRVWELLQSVEAETIVSELQRIHPPEPPAQVMPNLPV
jgi:2-hydroxychromene-2-carboxylate isomerase